MRLFYQIALAGVSLTALASPASAQDVPVDETASSEDIIVQARRKDESIQDVPLTVNAVSSDTIEKLNIRDFKDISAVVPGLNLAPGLSTTGSSATLRGLNVDNTASGNNGTVEFYLNDAPISVGALLQSMYDVGQIEVLRGPQGTLRGRASPSGSITVTTKRPIMDEWGGYVQGTATTIGGLNLNGAVNAPIVPGVLSLRVAGLLENNEANRVRSVNNPSFEPYAKTKSVRVSLRFMPTDFIELNGSYQHLVRNDRVFDQVESFGLAAGTPVVGRLITAQDRASVLNVPRINHFGFDVFNWQAKVSFAGQRFDYVGSVTKQDLENYDPADKGDVFDSTYPGDASITTPLNPQNNYSYSHSYPKQQTHEFRLSSENRVFGAFDYLVGGLISKLESPTDLNTFSSVAFNGAMAPANYASVLLAPRTRRGRTLERSFYGNLTAHLGDRAEIAGGLRHINYRENTSTNNGADTIFNTWIWNASAKYRFSDDLMVYATAGSSWRVGSGSNPLILLGSGVTGPVVDPYLQTFTVSQPERSKSYEIGFKSTFFDKQVTLNVSAFHQTFDGYIYSSDIVYFLNNTGTVNAPTFGNPTRSIAGLAASVPAKVDGVEVELAYRPSENFNISANFAYAKSKMNGVIPCAPRDANGNPIASPTTADVQQGVANRQVAQCTVSQSASRSAPFSANIQAEYSHDITSDVRGFVRGLLNINGDSRNIPTNAVDDVPAYALFNLYAGVRAPDGRWEVTAYGKNIFNTFRVLSRDAGATAINVRNNLTATTTSVNSNYRLITTTAPREFGLTAKFAFGSR